MIYTVKSGDSLYKIAKNHNITIEDILKSNYIANPDLIYPGQEIIISKEKTKTAGVEIKPKDEDDGPITIITN
ncbi:MAG TPA: LysM domain-containing protein [Sedimentibacter sp.]|jgi:LysM repeat protein|nr:LysM peptidoglycan-binding domain-containing protein [Sedimentibacter sp.]HNZ82193.1 LysM domain-containing protein [Sedimentibacter sp.]HOH70016.1 LysM domain-containing protein [Sedimentibacter sp.]HPX00013.1 LysM domain-containing protein [Sedimentibacter sp.]